MSNETKLWCLKTHDYITAVPVGVVEAMKTFSEEDTVPIEPIKTKPSVLLPILDLILSFLVNIIAVYATWNYGVVGALAVAKTITFPQAIALTLFINFVKARGKSKNILNDV